jgi:hypothetical protein
VAASKGLGQLIEPWHSKVIPPVTWFVLMTAIRPAMAS